MEIRGKELIQKIKAAKRAIGEHKDHKTGMVAGEIVDYAEQAIEAMDFLEEARENQIRVSCLPGVTAAMKTDAQKKVDDAFISLQAAESLLTATKRLARRIAPSQFYW